MPGVYRYGPLDNRICRQASQTMSVTMDELRLDIRRAPDISCDMGSACARRGRGGAGSCLVLASHGALPPFAICRADFWDIFGFHCRSTPRIDRDI